MLIKNWDLITLTKGKIVCIVQQRNGTFIPLLCVVDVINVIIIHVYLIERYW